MFVAEGAMRFLLTLTFWSGSMVLGFAQIPNASFENWSNAGLSQSPDGWVEMNSAQNPGTDAVSAVLSPAEDGWAVRLENVIAQSGGVVRAALITGADGFAYTLKPATLNGYLRYQPVGMHDECRIVVQFTRFNHVTRQREIIGEGSLTRHDFMWEYELFSIPITYTTHLFPDTAIITCYAGSEQDPQKGSVLELDDFNFDESATGVVIIDGDELGLKTSPNPAGEVMYLNNDYVEKHGSKYVIYDVKGKMMMTAPLEQNKGIDVGFLKDGEYFLLIYDDAGGVIAKASFIVTH